MHINSSQPTESSALCSRNALLMTYTLSQMTHTYMCMQPPIAFGVSLECHLYLECHYIHICIYSQLHLEFYSTSISNLDLTGLWISANMSMSVICVWVSTYVYECKHSGWQRPIGCLQLQVIFRKEPLIMGLFCGKWHVTIRHPMVLRHPVCM